MTPQSLRDPRAEAAAAKPDAALLKLVGEFNEVHDQAVAALSEWDAEKTRVEALSDCPPYLTPAEDRAAFDLHMAFLEEHGVKALGRHHVGLRERSGVLTSRIFATPARTVAGATEKLKIVRLAVGNLGEEDGDMDLNADQPDVEPRWFEFVIRDFERLGEPAGVDPDDPFPAWLAEWEVAQAEAERLGEELADDDEGDQQLGEFIDRRVSPVNDKLVNTPARTVAGVVIKARFAGRLGECGHAPPEALLATIFAGAEHVMRGPGVEVAGYANTDPMVALWSEWDGLRKSKAPDDLTDEEAREAFYADKGDQMEAIEGRIMASVPSTLAGALVQMSVMAELCSVMSAPPQKDIDATLAGIVAAQGTS